MINEERSDRDHDLLVQVAQDVKHLCKKIDDQRSETRDNFKVVHDKIENQMGHCTRRIDGCSKFFVSGKVFYWVLAFVIMALGSLSVATYQTREAVAVNTTSINLKQDIRK